MEIYNEHIHDLLGPENQNLQIHEDPHRGTYVVPLKEVIVTSIEDVLDVIRTGQSFRHTSTTDFNEYSSRSHTIFQMVIESRRRADQTHSASASSSTSCPSSPRTPQKLKTLKTDRLQYVQVSYLV